MPRKGFRSAYDSLGSDLTPAQVLAFHALTFGDCRMSNVDPAPAPVTPVPTPPATPPADPAAGGDDKGFPDNTPWRDMTPTQQVAYWQHQARKHETASKSRGDYDAIVAERDQLKAATQTDAEKAIEQARKEASDAAMASARNHFAGQLVAAKLEAALAGKVPADKIASQVAFLDHSKFLTDSGEVDTDKVTQYAAGISSAGTNWPDMGNGNRGGHTQTKGVSAGADMFAASRGGKTTT